ncbi:MAG: hypothetical protein GY928_30450 [Colwellia sp.]|nr:hypothetical protein [Colwellia sp.]
MKDTKKISLAQQCHDKTQGGFTLVTVLLLSSLASILVLTSLKDNITQERLSGNYQKKVNARLVSERGVFEYRKAALLYLDNNKTATLADLKAALGTLEDDGKLTGTKYQVTAKIDSVSGDLVLESTGNRYEGEQTLKARFKLTSGGGGSPFANAVVGCDGVTLTGSGQIDSYDSSDTSTFSTITKGEPPVSVFDKITTVRKKGDVSTINQDADVILTGDSPIYGDIQSTGKIDLLGTTKAHGSVHANGDIHFAQGFVKGSVRTRGNYWQEGATVEGYVRAVNNVDLMAEAKILGNGVTSLELALQYGGSFSYVDNEKVVIDWNTGGEFLKGKYRINPTDVEKVSEHDSTNPVKTDPATNCDHLDINKMMDLIDNGASTLPSLVKGSVGVFSFTPTEGKYITGGDGATFSAVEVSVLGEMKQVIKMEDLLLSKGEITISDGDGDGDVTLYIENRLQITGSAKITIAAGSSLTIMTRGTVYIAGSGKVVAEQHGLTSSGLPAFSIYSSYAGPTIFDNKNEALGKHKTYLSAALDFPVGINIEGDGELYAQIYAPLTGVAIPNSSTLYGAVRGKNVSVTGDGRIHYDAALGKADRGGSGGGVATRSSIKFEGFEY